MGRLHAQKLSARGDVHLAVVDPAQGLEEPGWRPDFAVVATPTATHARVAMPLLQAAVPCLVEKPLAADLATARELSRFAHLSVGHVERFNPALEVVEGSVRFVQAERLAPFPGRGTDVDVVIDLMVHDLDLALQWLSGPIRDVRAVGVGVLTGSADIVNARVEVGAGVAVFTASRVSRSPVRVVRLVGPGVYWSLDLLGRKVHRVRWGEGKLDEEAVPVPQGDPLEREHAAFLDAVRERGPFPVPGTEAVRVIELAERVRGALGAVEPA